MSTTYPPEWVQATVITGMIGIFCITIVAIHSTFNLHKEAIGTKLTRLLYISFFIMSWLTCFSFAFLRTNLILPMGDSIDCRIGFYSSTQGVFACKILLFIIFIYKIDLAFHESALAYSRWCLALTVAIYSIVILGLNGFYIKVTWKLINLASFEFENQSYGLCTSANDDEKFESANKMKLYCLAGMFLGDIIFSIFVCVLFVYKLNTVIKMMKEDKAHGDTTLAHLIRKQTILVIIACLTSLLSLGIGSVISTFSLLISLDITTNVICVGLMFTFSNKYWQFLVKRICCCCYCCVYKEEFLIQMQSISKKYSMRRDTTRRNDNVKSPIHSNANTNSNSNSNNNNKITISPYTAPNVKKQSQSQTQQHDDIVNFNNAKHIKSVNDNQKNENEIETPQTNDKMDIDDIEIVTSVDSTTKSTPEADNKDMEQDPNIPSYQAYTGYVESTENSASTSNINIHATDSTHL